MSSEFVPGPRPAQVTYPNSSTPVLISKISGKYTCLCGDTFTKKKELERHGSTCQGSPDPRANNEEDGTFLPPDAPVPDSLPPNAEVSTSAFPEVGEVGRGFFEDFEDEPPELVDLSLEDEMEEALAPRPQSPATDTSELVSETPLTKIGYYLNTRGRFLICITCSRGIIPLNASGHVHVQHKGSPFSLDIIQPYIDRFNLFDNHTLFKDYFSTLCALPSPLFRKSYKPPTAFDGIPIEISYYHCPLCLHASQFLQSMQTHWTKNHGGQPRPHSYDTGLAQNVYLSSQYKGCIPVREPLRQPEAIEIIEAWEDTYSRLSAEDTRPVDLGRKEVPSWLKKLGWLDWVANTDSVAMFEFLASVKMDGNFRKLSDCLVVYLEKAMKELVRIPPQIRQTLRSVTENVRPIMFNPPESDDTIVRYANFFTTLLIAHYCKSSNPTELELKDPLLDQVDQAPLLNKLFDLFSQDPPVPPSGIVATLHTVLLSLLVYRFKPTRTSVPEDPVFIFIVWNSRDRKGNFKRPNDITQFFSATQFIARSAVVTELVLRKDRDVKNDYYSQVKLLHPLMLQATATPLGNIYGAWITLLTAARDEVSLPNFMFTSSDDMQFIYHGAPGTVQGLRNVAHEALDEADKILTEEVLFGLDFPILAELPTTIYDDTANSDVNYWFLKDRRNKYQDPVRAFMSTMLVQDRESLSNFFGVSVNKKYTWSVPNCLQWLNRCQRFLRHFLISSHLTHGQPTRGSELMGTSFANAPNYPRSIFFVANEAVNALALNKTEGLTGHRTLSPHFFCPRGSRQLFVYLLLVRPVEIYVAKALLEITAFTESSYDNYRYYLFTGPQGRWDSVYFSNLIYKTTRDHLGVESGLKLSGLRQVLIAIYHRHCNSEYAESETKSPQDSFMEEIGDKQANHSSAVARAHYGVQPSDLGAVPSVKMIGFRQYSRIVHAFWLVLNLDSTNHLSMAPSIWSPPDDSSQGNLYSKAVREVMRHEFNDLEKTFTVSMQDMKKYLKQCLEDSIAGTANAIIKAVQNEVVSVPSYLDHPEPDLLEMLRAFDSTMTRFRSQEQATLLHSVIKRKEHNLAILPTGEGKSLLWMLPAKLLWQDKAVIVILPFVALLADCQRRCTAAGISHFEWTKETNETAPNFGVILVAVENAISSEFHQFASKLTALRCLQLIVVDECHLILTASNYRQGLPRLGYLLGLGVPLLFLTATLPPQLVKPFKSTLNLAQLSVTRRPNHYSNIWIQVRVKDNASMRIAATVHMAQKWRPHLEKNRCLALVICQTVDDCKLVAEKLGLEPYFGGLERERKDKLFSDWAVGKQVLLVSTTASGTGIDLPNIRGVLHCGPPWDILTYAQNVGRLGRGGALGVSYVIVDPKQRLRVKEEDLAGADVLNKLIFNQDHCRKLPLSTFVDGIAISCLTNKTLCDLCEVKLKRAGGDYQGTDGLPGVNILKRSHDDASPPSSPSPAVRPRISRAIIEESAGEEEGSFSSAAAPRPLFPCPEDDDSPGSQFISQSLSPDPRTVGRFTTTTLVLPRFPPRNRNINSSSSSSVIERPSWPPAEVGPVSADIALTMQTHLTRDQANEDFKFRQKIWDTLDSLKEKCMLCWLAHDSFADHQPWNCSSIDRSLVLQMRKQMSATTIPKNRCDEWLCYACFTPSKFLYSGDIHENHGNGSSQDVCRFHHVLRPITWASWHFSKIRLDLVSLFKPRDRRGKAIINEQDWPLFFDWCFQESQVHPRFMNLFSVLTWLSTNSHMFTHVYNITD